MIYNDAELLRRHLVSCNFTAASRQDIERGGDLLVLRCEKCLWRPEQRMLRSRDDVIDAMRLADQHHSACSRLPIMFRRRA